MKITRVFLCPKEGNTDAQYEDAYCLAESSVALTDGASAAVFARQWASLLAKDFAEGAPFPIREDAFWERITALGARWAKDVTLPREDSAKQRAWWAEEKIPQGSAASLLVVRFDGVKLHAASIGDACLFLVRSEKLKFAFPLKKSSAFGNHPPLVPTEPARMKKKPPIVRFSVSVEPGDRIFLCTDALAQWFLLSNEKKARPWDELSVSESEFGVWVQARRDDDTLKNDDVTLVELAI